MLCLRPKACFAMYFALVPSAIVRCRWKLLPRREDTRQALARGLCSAKLSSSTFTSACNVTSSLALSQAEMHCPQDLKFGHQSVGLAVQKTGLMRRKASTRHAWSSFPAMRVCTCNDLGAEENLTCRTSETHAGPLENQATSTHPGRNACDCVGLDAGSEVVTWPIHVQHQEFAETY